MMIETTHKLPSTMSLTRNNLDSPQYCGIMDKMYIERGERTTRACYTQCCSVHFGYIDIAIMC